MNTTSGSTKRIKGNGIRNPPRPQPNRQHNFEHKPSTQTRRLAGTTEVSDADRKRIRKLLGK